ncbi:hypothetical protein [Pseudoxanthomonas sp. PXM05]|uniref:hypothetical protein n=1 Tax=Pseudoxanthomonas sp. PXM05 TaxID=2854775 RepID=UPI001C45B461|nr:hypothetical protein [Pseudoxanthomonas sp. PXM05]MBV7475352.1 hypothetical protein [Pseudoxanthomonas sp. PXM05]
MTTPDPIALPELPANLATLLARVYADAYQAGHDATVEGEFIDLHPNDRDTYWLDHLREHPDVKAYALTPAPQVPEGMAVNAERYLYLRNIAHPDSESGLAVSFSSQNDWGKWCSEYPTGEELDRMVDAERSAAPSTPPLNELLGQPEEFNLNEVSGSSGQLASVELRARDTAQASRNLAQTIRKYGLCAPAALDEVARRIDEIADALSAQARVVEWRCFYCDEVLTDTESAALHFGTGGMARHDEPACRIDIAKYRAMESLLSRYQDEDADVHRAVHRMAGEHQLALRRAEEDGYAKGLKDSAKCPCAAPQPREVRGVDDATRRFLKSHDLYQLLMNIQSGISSPGDASMANSLIRRLDKIRDSLVATTPPDGAKGER